MSSIAEMLMNNAAADTDLLRKNDGHGDKFTIPRIVDFLFRAPSKEKAEIVASFVKDMQYGTATIQCENNEYSVLVQIEMPITQNILCCVSGFMTCLGKVFGVEYDGWGSIIQTGS